YVTLESALAFYNLIPEGVFMTTSVTTRNTARYRTPVGYFEYSHIKPSLFFGYRLVQTNDLTYKIASPEKAILDFFYARKHATESSIEEIRFNEWAIKDLIDFDLLEKFLLIFDSKILYKRIGIFKSVINA
ncbi:MAG: hypothetical protein OEX02_21355, partial [Cyclobacteriaceae bacterium]|nr:hypothetical protein [Cyclobacteriaceae bacterium]